MREERNQALQTLPDEGRDAGVGPVLSLYEAQQAPLAYLMFVPAWLALRQKSLPVQVWALRLVCAFLASLAIPLCFLIGRRVFASEIRAAGVTVVVASMPELMILVTHISNEALALPLGTACIYSMLRLVPATGRPIRQALEMGLVFGCALLTKAYFPILLLPMLVAYAGLWWRDRRRTLIVAGQLLLTISVAAVLAGWWYVRNLSITGTWTGEQTAAAAAQSGVSFAQAVMRADWIRMFDFAVVTHIWVGGWSFLIARGWMYRVVEILLLAAAAGMLIALLRRYRRDDKFALAVCGSTALLFWIVPVYQALAGYRRFGKAETFGYYAYCVVAAEAVCLIAGLATLLPKAGGRWVVPGVATVFAAFEVFGVNFLMMPYYSGITLHTARGSVPALHLGSLANGGAVELFHRLAYFKPDFLTGAVLMALWTVWVAGTLGIVMTGFVLARPGSGGVCETEVEPKRLCGQPNSLRSDR